MQLRLFDGALTTYLTLGGTLQEGDLVRTRNGSLWKVLPLDSWPVRLGNVPAKLVKQGQAYKCCGPTNADVKINKLVGLYRGCTP